MAKVTLISGKTLYLGSERFAHGKPKEVDEKLLNYIKSNYATRFDIEEEPSHNEDNSQVGELQDTIGFEPPVVVTKDTFDGLAEKTHAEIDKVAESLNVVYSTSKLNREQKVEEIKEQWFQTIKE